MSGSSLEAAQRPSERMGTAPGVRTYLALAGLFFVCFVYFLPRWHDWNQDARLDMTMAVVNHATIAIDAYQRNTSDDDHYQGHYYSNKAPGQSLLGVPVYAAFKLALAIPPFRTAANSLETRPAWRLALEDAGCTRRLLKDPCRFIPKRLDFALLQYLESALTVAIPSILMLLLFFWFLQYLSASVLNRMLATLAFGLGTIIFPYSQEFYSHVPAAALELAAFVLLYIAGRTAATGSRLGEWLVARPTFTAVLAGICLGLAVVFEYPAALMSAVIGLYGLLRLPRSAIVPLIAGCVPGLAIVMGYNFLAYHNPLTTGYGCNEKIWAQECRGIAGFTWPPAGNAIDGMTASRYRGLFFLSPFLLLAFPGFLVWAIRSRRDWMTPVTAFVVPLMFFFAISAYWGWYGGQVVGPRYLIPILPFLALPVVLVLDRVQTLAGRLAVWALLATSVVMVWLETIGGRAYGGGGVHDPLFDYNLPQLAHGTIPLNLGMLAGIPGPGSLWPLPGLLLLAGAGPFLPQVLQSVGGRREKLQLAGRERPSTTTIRQPSGTSLPDA